LAGGGAEGRTKGQLMKNPFENPGHFFPWLALVVCIATGCTAGARYAPATGPDQYFDDNGLSFQALGLAGLSHDRRAPEAPREGEALVDAEGVEARAAV
jgi:hypothetical protein